MLNVVVVSDFAHIEGGNSAVALWSAMGLAGAGHRVTLLSAVLPVEPAVLGSGIRVVCTHQYAIGKDPRRIRALIQGIWNRRAAQSMADALQGLDVRKTIVHVHGWSKSLSSSVVRIALSRKFKVVCTLHDYFSACPNGSFFNYSTNQVCKLRPLSAACIASQCDRRHYGHKLWRVARQVVQNYLGGIPRNIRHFIVVSEFSGQILSPFLPPSARVYQVPNPVQASRTVPVDARSNSAYVMVGRIAQEKGPHLFAEAAHALACKAVFVGDGEQRAVVLQLCPSARVTGWLPRKEVLGQLREARVLVFPSLWYETDGLVVLEAAALGIPVIVSDGSVARASVIDGVTGLWFKAGDKTDLINKMAAMRDHERVARMGRAAYAHFWERPRTLNRHVEELENIYQEILNEHLGPDG
jgi:glycosyltransferase involved in cell wall biosynthesis